MERFNFSLSRRCIAVDLGQSRIKGVLAERKGNRIEILHAFTLDLQDEGLLGLEETNRQISRILREMGDYPVSLVIPQHIAVSHLIALPTVGRGGWGRLVEQETQKLTGLSESAIVYDYFRLRPFHRHRNPVWVTVSRELELDSQIKRLQSSGLEVGEVTNTGNALASVYLATHAVETRVVLVDVGAASTTVVVLQERQPVYATSFPLGGELLTEAVATARRIGFDEAEPLKKTRPLLEAQEPMAPLLAAVNNWQQELEQILSDWLKDSGGPEQAPLKVLVSGGVSLQLGLLEYLDAHSAFTYTPWKDTRAGIDLQTYAVVYGTALSGLKSAQVRTTLLPKPLRQKRSRTRILAGLNTLAATSLLILLALLLNDTSSRRKNLQVNSALLADLDRAQAQTHVVSELWAQRNVHYDKLVPVVQQKRRTRDLLKTMSLMQDIRGEHEAWFVLLADGQSYLEQTTYTSPSAGAPREARPRSLLEPTVLPQEEERAAWNRFVIEICVPGSGREIHDTLRSVVNTFRGKGIFSNVDTLAASERRLIVDPKVTLPDKTVPLVLELVPSDFVRRNGEGAVQAQTTLQP
jgi:Tfp pilus assembly PilM family ATPase